MTSSSVVGAAARAATRCWTAVGHIAGTLGRWEPERWQSPGGQRVLVVAPHPDDEIGCGGALLLHRAAGDEIHVLHATDGWGWRNFGLRDDELAELRRREAEAATRRFGFHRWYWLGLRAWHWEDAVLVAALSAHLRAVAPDVLYAPSRIDFHPEHVRVAACMARALDVAGSPTPAVRMYPVQVPLTPLLGNLVAPIQDVAGELFRAMGAYRTQLASLERCKRLKRYAAACYGLPVYAEEFWQVTADAYTRIHAGAEWGGGRRGTGSDAVFRGMRWWSFSDPLSYLRGTGARRRLRRMAADGVAAQEVA